MSPPRSLGLVGLLALAACDADTVEKVEVLPYDGEPYPNRVAPIEYPSGPSALITDSYSDTVSVVDLTTGTTIDTRIIGRNPVDLDGPHHLAADPERGFAYIALSYPKSSAIGPHAAHGSATLPGYIQKLRLEDLSIVGQVRVDPSPGDIALSEDGKRVVTSHFDLLRATQNPTNIDAARSTIAVVEPEGLELVDSTPPRFVTVCVAPHGMKMTQPTGSPLYVACYGEDKIAVVDLDDETTELVDVGPGVSGFGAPLYGPYAIEKLPNEPVLAISNTASKDVRFFDIETGEMDESRTIPTLGAPYFVAFSEDGNTIVIPTQQPDALVLVDLTGETEPVTRTFAGDECDLPHVVTRVGDGYAVVCEGDKKAPGKVVILDADLEIASAPEVGVYPDSITVVGGAQ